MKAAYIMVLAIALLLASPVKAEYSTTFQGDAIELNFSGSSPVNWTVDGSTNTETGTTLSISFEKAGNHYITADNGAITNNFTVTVKRALATTEVEKLDETDYNFLMNSIETENFSGIGTTVMNPYTNLVGRGAYLFLFVLPFVFIWKSQGSLSIPTILALIFGCIFIGFIPQQYTTFIIIAIILAFAVALYNLVRDRA